MVAEPVVGLRYGPPTEQLAVLVAPEEKAACPLHGGLEAECAHVDVRQPFLAALGVQLLAPLSNPGCRLVEFRGRCLGLMLRLWAAVAGKVVGGKGAMAEEACPDACSRESGLQARGVCRRQLEALDKELLGFLDAPLGCLFDVWVHEFGQPRGVDRVLVDRVKLGQDTAQHRPDHVARKPWDPVSCQESLSQRGLTHPGCTTEEVEDAASHGGILPTDPRGRPAEPRD
jgi:hypothetical protein